MILLHRADTRSKEYSDMIVTVAEVLCCRFAVHRSKWDAIHREE
jgi:hypothetical protein